MHPSEGKLQTWLDGELDAVQFEQIKAHLHECPACRQQVHDLQARAVRLHNRLASLNPLPSEAPPPALAARKRLQGRLTHKENPSMFQKLFAPRYRFAWAILALVLLLAVALTFQPVRALASSFLGLFRVEKVQVVEFNPANLPDDLSFVEQTFSEMLSEDLKIEGGGEPQVVASAAEASAKAGIPVRLPEAVVPEALSVQPSARVNATINLERIRAFIDAFEGVDIDLPDELDGAKIEADVPSSVTALFGNCTLPQAVPSEAQDPDSVSPSQDCIALVQLATPTVNTPPGLDVAAIGKAYLQMLGMSAADAERYSLEVNWASTLVVPVPPNADYQAVNVDGVEGALIQEADEASDYSFYLLIWVKDGVMYAINGRGDAAAALQIANSLK